MLDTVDVVSTHIDGSCMATSSAALWTWAVRCCQALSGPGRSGAHCTPMHGAALQIQDALTTCAGSCGTWAWASGGPGARPGPEGGRAGRSCGTPGCWKPPAARCGGCQGWCTGFALLSCSFGMGRNRDTGGCTHGDILLAFTSDRSLAPWVRICGPCTDLQVHQCDSSGARGGERWGCLGWQDKVDMKGACSRLRGPTGKVFTLMLTGGVQ